MHSTTNGNNGPVFLVFSFFREPYKGPFKGALCGPLVCGPLVENLVWIPLTIPLQEPFIIDPL